MATSHQHDGEQYVVRMRGGYALTFHIRGASAASDENASKFSTEQEAEEALERYLAAREGTAFSRAHRGQFVIEQLKAKGVAA